MSQLPNGKSLYNQKIKIIDEIERLYVAIENNKDDFEKNKNFQKKIYGLQKELKRIEFKQKIGGMIKWNMY